MTDKNPQTKRWVILVAQEFEIEAETADLALEIARVMERRTFQGIAPTSYRAALGPDDEERDD